MANPNQNVMFSSWNVAKHGALYPPVMLQSSHRPRKRGVYIMYHGTNVASARLIAANGFKQSKDGLLGPGVYVSRDKNKASHYPLNSSPADRVVLELHVRVGRVKRISRDNHPMQKTWHSHGYNTAWVPPNAGLQSVPSGMEEDCVYNPKRVKVVGIAIAPNQIIKAELEKLLAQKVKRRGHGHGKHHACGMCRKKSHHDVVHNAPQMCWGCGQQICTLMSKHLCLA